MLKQSPVIAEPPQVQVQKFVQELDATETAAVPPAPIQPADDPDFQELLFTVERLNEALGGSLGVDEDFLIYSKCRERMSALCRSLVERSREYCFEPSLYLTKTSSRSIK